MGSAIIHKAISGNPEALSILIEKYRDIAYNLALGIVADKEEAKDITQDSFLIVLENIQKFRNESKFSTWLYKIVYNQSIGYLKKNNKRREHKNIGIYSDNSAVVEDDHQDQYDDIYMAIEKLNKNEKNVILLFYLGEKSIREIKNITGLSVANIKVILHRARKKIQERLDYGNVR